MLPRAVICQHVPHEGPDLVATILRSRGYEILSVPVYDGAPIPELSRGEWLVFMGGPMSVNEDDRYPWMQMEHAALATALEQDVRVLGICLGAQLIARHLGARVYAASQREIGYFPVTFDFSGARRPALRDLGNGRPGSLDVLHWHGETFDLPEGSDRLASSAVCENQMFAVGTSVVGIQFHLEISVLEIRRFVEGNAHEIAQGPAKGEDYVMPAQEIMDHAGFWGGGAELLEALIDVMDAQ